MKTDPAYDGRRARRRGLPPVPVHDEHKSGNSDTKEMPPRLPPPEPPLLGRPLSSLPKVEPAGIIRDRPRLIFKPSHALAAILVLVLALATSLTLFVQQSISLAGSAPQAGEAADRATGGKPVGGRSARGQVRASRPRQVVQASPQSRRVGLIPLQPRTVRWGPKTYRGQPLLRMPLRHREPGHQPHKGESPGTGLMSIRQLPTSCRESRG